jgi:hypothetical protein
MKKLFIHGLLILLFVVDFTNNAHAQSKKIVIKSTEGLANTVFKKFEDPGGDITTEELKKSDIDFHVVKIVNADSVFRMENGKPIKPGLGKKAHGGQDGFVYTLGKDQNYDGSPIEFQLKQTNGKTTNFKIAPAKDEPPREATAAPKTIQIIPCEQLTLDTIHYRFIPHDILESLEKECGDTICNDCEPEDNVITYNFKNNKVNKIFGSKRRYVKVGNPLEFVIKQANPYLFDVTISDTLINYNQEDVGGFLSLLTEAKFDKNGETSTQNRSTDPCPVSDTLKLLKATEDLYSQLNLLYQNLLLTGPYVDASCFAPVLRKVKMAINAVLANNFSRLGIYSYNNLINFFKSSKNIISEANIKKLEELYAKVGINHSVFAHKIPEVDNVDEVRFRFNILPKNKDLALPVVKGGAIRAYTRGGFKVDVSSGLYFANLSNDQFGLRKDSVKINVGLPDTFRLTKRIYQDLVGNGEFGFASYMHFYPRTGGWLNASLTIGAGVSFSDKPKPRYFGGISVMAGRGQNRLVINVGVAAGNVTRLSDQYRKDGNGNYLQLPDAESGIQTKQKFMSGWFVGISYNLPFALKKGKTPQETTPPPVKTPAPTDTTKKTAAPAAANQTSNAGNGNTAAQGSGTTVQMLPAAPAQMVVANAQPMLKEKQKRKFRKNNR